jgi:hypothetical protein
VRNPVLAAAVVSSVLLAGLVAWHTRGGNSDENPVVNPGPSPAAATRRISLLERGALRRSATDAPAATADALWVAAEQIQRELHAATTRGERDRLLAELETIVRQMNALQADTGGTL